MILGPYRRAPSVPPASDAASKRWVGWTVLGAVAGVAFVVGLLWAPGPTLGLALSFAFYLGVPWFVGAAAGD